MEPFFQDLYVATDGPLFARLYYAACVVFLWLISPCLDLQPLMSDYFWAATQEQCASFPMRTIFVGYLFAIGVGLFAYKGLTKLENILLNVAALCALAVAIYPEGLSLKKTTYDPRVAQLFESCPAVRDWS